MILIDVFGAELPSHKAGIAHFDARLFVLPTTGELLNNILWRCHYDCQRNAKSAFARSFMSAKQTHKINTKEQIARVADEHGIDYTRTVPPWAQYGTMIKRELFAFSGRNPKTDLVEITQRCRIISQAILIDSFSESNLALLLAKYWPENTVL